MIVSPAVHEDGRTLWRLEPEPGDIKPSRSTLWIEGFVRPISPGTETLWLALALQPFARHRLVLPTIGSTRLGEAIGVTLGITVVGRGGAREEEPSQREFSAVLVRDPLDLFISQLARSPASHAIEMVASPAGASAGTRALRIASNAGALRREVRPLDRVGELASSIMLAPTLCLRSLDSFACREEIADVDPGSLARLCAMAGVRLGLPFAGTSVSNLGRHAVSLGIPPIVAFRNLWKRYQMAPEVVAELYRELAPSLVAGDADGPALRISEYFAGRIPADMSTGTVQEAIDDGFFTAVADSRAVFPTGGSAPISREVQDM